MGTMSVIVMAGTARDLALASDFPPDVKWDKVVKIAIPDDHGQFPDTSGYEMADFQSFETDMEDHQLFPYMTKAVDACLDFLNRNGDRLVKLNFRNIHTSMSGMNTGGDMFVVAGFVDYDPMMIDKRRPNQLITDISKKVVEFVRPGRMN